MNRRIKILMIAFMISFMVMMPVQEIMADKSNEELVIVIDPGHGGSQKGADYNGIMEKDINIIVAKSMAEELSKYDGVKVVLTHESAEDEMSIKERAEFAKKVKADYFFCIHFNASGNHNFYGAETWVTSYGRYYSEMYAFSEILLKEFETIGVYDRGIKTKLETDGTDYYGVLRRGAEFDIPAVIIEHCHMDHEEDTKFLDEEKLIQFGQMDAVAAAKFLQLKSSETGADYSDYEVTFPEEPQIPIPNDETPPECHLTLVSMNDGEEKAVFRIDASDEEYPILYYGYSLDGGETFTTLSRWNRDESFMEFELPYGDCTVENIIAVVYNAYNMDAKSETVSLNEIKEHLLKLEEEERAAKEALAEAETYVVQRQTGGEIYLVIAVLCLLGIVIAILGLILDIKKAKM